MGLPGVPWMLSFDVSSSPMVLLFYAGLMGTSHSKVLCPKGSRLPHKCCLLFYSRNACFDKEHQWMHLWQCKGSMEKETREWLVEHGNDVEVSVYFFVLVGFSFFFFPQEKNNKTLNNKQTKLNQPTKTKTFFPQFFFNRCENRSVSAARERIILIHKCLTFKIIF